MQGFYDLKDTIVAVSTPIGVGGISVVRLSGDKAVCIADKFFTSITGKKPSEFQKRRLEYGNFEGNHASDSLLTVVFDKNSFTGESVVEFQCHGGILVANGIVKDCIDAGARQAKNGEFSLRAVLNGKMSLCDAEGMIDMINSESEAERKASREIMKGGLTAKVDDFQKSLADLMSEVEVSFDYPEEDIEYIAQSKLKVLAENLLGEIDSLLSTYSSGAIIKSGIKACLVGKPNVGKSSLLNALLNKNKAIVTEIAGTTRDVIEDAFSVNGVKVNILDTAGIRDTSDLVEKIGVDRSIDALKEADIILLIVEAGQSLSREDAQILALLDGKKYLTVHNKCDRASGLKKSPDGIYTSAKTGEGIEQLKQRIYDMVIKEKVVSGGLTITSERHKDCLVRAKNSILSAISAINSGDTLDLASVDLKEAYEALGEITGKSGNEEILDNIFSKFCLGK